MTNINFNRSFLCHGRLARPCLLLLLLLNLPALAEKEALTDDVRWQATLCPSCGRAVKVAMLLGSSDAMASLDKDLFVRTNGPQPEFYLINTCSWCYFSGYLSDFDLVLPEKTKKDLKKALKPATPIKPDTPQREIETLDKYELAYQTFKLLGRSDEAFGWLALRASWVARDLYCILPKDPEVVKVLKDAANLLPPPTEKNTNPTNHELLQAKKLAALAETTSTPSKISWATDAVIGILYRRHGEDKLALPYIDKVINNKNAPNKFRQTYTKMRQSINAEQYWQGLAAEHFNRAITTGTITPENKPTAKYLLGQLYYRLNQKSDAKLWLNEALIDKNLPPYLVEWAKETQELVK